MHAIRKDRTLKVLPLRRAMTPTANQTPGLNAITPTADQTSAQPNHTPHAHTHTHTHTRTPAHLHTCISTTTNPFTLHLQDGVVQEADDDGEDPPLLPSYEETLRKCREIIESASSGLEGGRLALARLVYAAVIDSGFEDWSGENFEWSDGWEEPGDVLTAWHAALEATVVGFDLANDGDMLEGGETDWMDTEELKEQRSPMTQEQLNARRHGIMQVSECVLISRCSVVISTVSVLISRVSVLISTVSVLISTVSVLISTGSTLISTESVLISTPVSVQIAHSHAGREKLGMPRWARKSLWTFTLTKSGSQAPRLRHLSCRFTPKPTGRMDIETTRLVGRVSILGIRHRTTSSVGQCSI